MKKTLLLTLLLGLYMMSQAQTAKEYLESGLAKRNLQDYQGAIADMDKAIALQTKENPADNSYYIRGLAKIKIDK